MGHLPQPNQSTYPHFTTPANSCQGANGGHPPEPYCKVPDLKKYFAIGQYKAWDLLRSGKLRGKRVGREWHIQTKSVFKFMEAGDSRRIQNAHNG